VVPPDGGGGRLAVLVANYLSSFAIGLAIGGIVPFLSLVMERRGVGEVMIGANPAAASLGIIVVAPFVPAIVRRVGLATSVIAGIVISVVAFLAMGIFESLAAWFLLRPIVAGGTAIQWIVSETWMNAISTRRDRGRIMAVYVTAVAAGLRKLGLLPLSSARESWLKPLNC
jgi:MFS family permease